MISQFCISWMLAIGIVVSMVILGEEKEPHNFLWMLAQVIIYTLGPFTIKQKFNVYCVIHETSQNRFKEDKATQDALGMT